MPFNGTLPHDFPHFATGPTLVRFGTYYDLGYSEDRIQIEERPFWHEVHSDGYGGAEGPPCDVQFLGELVYVRCLLNRFNETNLRRLSRLYPTAPQNNGTLLAPGTYMRQDNGMDVLELLNAAYTLTYSKAILKNARKFTVGTRHQAFAIDFECHVDDSCDLVLFTYDDADDPCS